MKVCLGLYQISVQFIGFIHFVSGQLNCLFCCICQFLIGEYLNKSPFSTKIGAVLNEMSFIMQSLVYLLYNQGCFMLSTRPWGIFNIFNPNILFHINKFDMPKLKKQFFGNLESITRPKPLSSTAIESKPIIKTINKKQEVRINQVTRLYGHEYDDGQTSCYGRAIANMNEEKTQSRLECLHSRVQDQTSAMFKLNMQDVNNFDKQLNSVQNIKLSSKFAGSTNSNLAFKKVVESERKSLNKRILKQKVKNMVNVFVQKLLRNRANQHLMNYDVGLNAVGYSRSMFNIDGITLNFCQQFLRSGASLALCLLLFILLSRAIIYSQPEHSQQKILHAICLFLLVCLIALNCTVVSKRDGRTLGKLNQIAYFYLKSTFYSDVLCLLTLIINLAFQTPTAKYLYVFFLLKLMTMHKQLQRIDYLCITNFHKEQYWKITRLVCYNFVLAHLISMAFLVAARFSPESNWIVKAKLQDTSQLEQYIWAYYWSMTTMLSVGYGDITPANYYEALLLIFLEFVSCISLAYTINCVGELMFNIRRKDEERKKNMKTIRGIIEANPVCREVEEKVSSYVEEAIKVKQKFNFEERKNLIADLPKDIRSDLLKQCNFQLFKNVPLFKFFTAKTVLNFAQKIDSIITHPEQVINPLRFFVLKQGHIGYYAKVDRMSSNYLMNQLKVVSDQPSRLICLNFLNKDKINYVIKSISYSLVYAMSEQLFLATLKKRPEDYQHYCVEKDKHKIMIDELETMPCSFCVTSKHLKSCCPKIHYMPYRSLIIQRQQSGTRRQKCIRADFGRRGPANGWRHPYVVYSQIRKQYCEIGMGYTNGLTLNILEEMCLFRKKTEHFLDQCPPQTAKSIFVAPRRKRGTTIVTRMINQQTATNQNNSYSEKNYSHFHSSYRPGMSEPNYQRYKSFNTSPQFEDPTGISCDALHDYRNYFPNCNARYVEGRRQKAQQVRRRKQAKRMLEGSSE